MLTIILLSHYLHQAAQSYLIEFFLLLILLKPCLNSPLFLCHNISLDFANIILLLILMHCKNGSIINNQLTLLSLQSKLIVYCKNQVK